MPYIRQELRDELKFEVYPENAGELNYVFTMIIKEYWRSHHNYQGINDIVGALEGAKSEFTRRQTNPYEDTKMQENGDVY